MIYFETNKDGVVTFVHYRPFDEKDGLGKTQEELQVKGYLVNKFPETKPVEGGTEIVKYDKKTEEFAITFTPSPSDEKDVLYSDLVYDSMMKDIRIEELETAYSDLTYQLMMAGVI